MRSAAPGPRACGGPLAAQVHTWLLFNAGAACEALCAGLAEGGARAGAAERVLGGTLEALLRARAASGRPDVRTGYGVARAARCGTWAESACVAA